MDSLLAALGAGWQQAPGLIGIVETRTPVGTGPKETLAALLELDPLASQ